MSIEEFYDFKERLSKELTLLLDRPVADRDVMNALYLLFADKDDMEWIGDVWDLDINYQQALDVLINFDFKTLTQQIEIEDQAIPSHFVLNKKFASRRLARYGSFIKTMPIRFHSIHIRTMPS